MPGKRVVSRKTSKVTKPEVVVNTPAEVVEVAAEAPRKTICCLPEFISVGEYAEKLGLPIAKVIGELMKCGVMATINEEIDFETAAIVGDDLGFEVKPEEAVVEKEEEEVGGKLEARPAVVTIMGHVDHGKTSILDKIRETNVAGGESGGITQHIGAYQVVAGKKTITFLDTPGHEAFAAMRAHGAGITDIVILVVAADDGVKPQTLEAANHAKAAGVPIIVAINKIDKAQAEPQRVMQELTAIGLQPEEWGGQTVTVKVSAHTGEGIEQLLEMILLVAEMQQYKARFEGLARGVVIEAHLDSGLGPVATVLVQQGVLNVADMLVAGSAVAKVKAMHDFKGKKIKEAGPSVPVLVAGFSEVPDFGVTVKEFENEQQARAVAEKAAHEKKVKRIRRPHLGIMELSDAIRAGKIKELKVVLKADVQGSLEAIKGSLERLQNADVKVNIIHDAVGNINESDINMASASGGLVIGFRVGETVQAKKVADMLGVKVSSYDVIYQLIDDIFAALEGLLEPEIVEVPLGVGEILAIFITEKKFHIIGTKIVSGKVERGALARVYRGEVKLGECRVTSLKVVQEDMKEVEAGNECGIAVDGDIKYKVGDRFEFYKIEERLKKLS